MENPITPVPAPQYPVLGGGEGQGRFAMALGGTCVIVMENVLVLQLHKMKLKYDIQ